MAFVCSNFGKIAQKSEAFCTLQEVFNKVLGTSESEVMEEQDLMVDMDPVIGQLIVQTKVDWLESLKQKDWFLTDTTINDVIQQAASYIDQLQVIAERDVLRNEYALSELKLEWNLKGTQIQALSHPDIALRTVELAARKRSELDQLLL